MQDTTAQWFPVEDYPLAEFDNVIAVHLRAAFLLTKLVLPEMYARPVRRDLEYLESLSQGRVRLGLGLCCGKSRNAGAHAGHGGGRARKGVRVNAICPGQ